MKKALVSIAVSLVLAPAASADPLKVKIDQTLTVRLGIAPGSIIVGNPAVAGVALKDGDTLLITGKKFGATNIVVLDESGRIILSNQIAVRTAPKAKLHPAQTPKF